MTRTMVVTRLSTTPVKGLRVHEPEEIVVDERGAVGDRAFLLVGEDDRVRSVPLVGALLRLRADHDPGSGRLTIVADDGRACEGTVALGAPLTASALESKRIPAREVLGPWSAFVSDFAGEPLRLVRPDEVGAAQDVAPVTLLGEGSLEELGRRSGLGDVDPRRFRMLIRFGPSEPHVEDGWEGRTLGVGDVRLRVGGTVPRCAATTRDPERGERDAPIVRAIKDYRGIRPTGYGEGVPFGVYADVVRGGRIRVGDPVRLDGEISTV